MSDAAKAETEAREYLAAVSPGHPRTADYERAVRKAAAAFARLHKAVRLARRLSTKETPE